MGTTNIAEQLYSSDDTVINDTELRLQLLDCLIYLLDNLDTRDRNLLLKNKIIKLLGSKFDKARSLLNDRYYHEALHRFETSQLQRLLNDIKNLKEQGVQFSDKTEKALDYVLHNIQPQSTALVVEQVWQTFGNHFADESSKYFFDLCGEPCASIFKKHLRDLKPYDEQRFIDIISKTLKNHEISDLKKQNRLLYTAKKLSDALLIQNKLQAAEDIRQQLQKAGFKDIQKLNEERRKKSFVQTINDYIEIFIKDIQNILPKYRLRPTPRLQEIRPVVAEQEALYRPDDELDDVFDSNDPVNAQQNLDNLQERISRFLNNLENNDVTPAVKPEVKKPLTFRYDATNTVKENDKIKSNNNLIHELNRKNKLGIKYK